MTQAHSSLTGADLHEPKGVGIVDIDLVYVSDGEGSGNWQKLSTAQMSTTDNPFDANLVHVRDSKAVTTNPQSLTATTWNIRALQTTVTNELSGASLASSQITLPAGTYFVESSVPGFACDLHKAKLYNLTSAADQIIGSAAFASSVAPYGMSHSIIKGKFELTVASSFEIRHYVSTTSTSVALATGVSAENYTEVWFWKIG